MNLLYITPSLGAGGAERQASILLPALRRRGIDARALALDSGGPFAEPLRVAGVPVEVLNMRHRFDLLPLVCSKLVRQFAPEVIVSRGVSGLYVGDALARWRRAAHIYNDHRGIGVELSPRRSAMIALLARRVSSVIVVSFDQCEGWLDYGCTRDRIEVIPNGIRIAGMASGRAEVRRELGLGERAVVAMIVASLRPVKHVPDFVEAVRRARERCPELIGVVVGDGSERGAVLRAAAGDPAIRLLGHRDDVPRILQAADLVALTSLHEAMPMAILEAMAAGLPSVATNVGGVGKIIADGETGVLVPAGDPDTFANALVRLTTDRDLRHRMGRAGRERCRRRWNAENMTDRYCEVFTRVHAARPVGRWRAQQPLFRALVIAFLRYLHRRGWFTWQRTAEEADVLSVTNDWPDGDRPTRAPFVRATVDGLAAAGVKTDLVYVRGYRGPHVYLLACAAMALLPLARRGKYKLVHSHGGESALVARFFWGAPVLATYWGSDLLGPRYGGRGTRLKSVLRSRLLRLHARLMTATTTKTSEMERVLPRAVQRRNWVIPDGVDPSQFKPVDGARARAALGWPADVRIVISAGSGGMKRHWLAEQAVELAARELPGLRWHALTAVPPEDMPLYYNAADLLLHTSFSEGSPNVIKEAHACQLPVASTQVGDIADLLEGVEPSALCDDRPEALAHEIVRILRDGRRSNGREQLHRLGIDTATARTIDCYRSVGAPSLEQ